MSRTLILGIGSLIAIGGGLRAGVLAPGATIALSGTTYAEDNELGGSVRWDGNVAFEIRNAADEVFIAGTLKDAVTVSNITHELIFTRAIRDLVATAGAARIVGMTSSDFSGLDVVAEFRTDAIGTIAPVSASRSAGSGDEVSFDFTGAGLAPPSDSRSCFAKTNANAFSLGATVTISAVETAGGAVFSVDIGNLLKPDLLPTDRVVVQSVETLGTSQVRIRWLSITAMNYRIYSAPDPAGPWAFERSESGNYNPREDTFSISGGFSVQKRYFFRIEEDP